MIRILSAAVLCFSATAALAQTPSVPQRPFPKSGAEYYQAGSEFARCSATFNFAAGIARAMNMKDSAVAYEGMERGWRLTGLFLLADGLEPSRQSETEKLFDTLRDGKIDQLKAWRELDPNGFTERSLKDYADHCDQWYALRVSILNAMRGAKP